MSLDRDNFSEDRVLILFNVPYHTEQWSEEVLFQDYGFIVKASPLGNNKTTQLCLGCRSLKCDREDWMFSGHVTFIAYDRRYESTSKLVQVTKHIRRSDTQETVLKGHSYCMKQFFRGTLSVVRERHESVECKVILRNSYQAKSWPRHHNPHIFTSNLKFDEPWEDSDVVFKVEEKPVHCHRQVLSITSPVFKTMFNSRFVESKAGVAIPLPEKKHADFVNFLRSIYPRGGTVTMTSKEIFDLIPLFHEYQVPGLEKSAKQIVGSSVNKYNCIRTLCLADKYGYTDIREAALKAAKVSTYTDLQKDRYYTFLQKDTQFLLLEACLRHRTMDGTSGDADESGDRD